MKKYLITVALAVVVSGSFIGCKEDDFSGSKIEQKVQAFEEAFVRAFGQPNPNHTWGFEELDNGEDNSGITRSANTEHNQWAAVDNIYKLLVPPALTDGQKQRVKIYFQYNRYLTYKDPHMTDFFVQQVYEGSTAPGTLSSEVYTSGNGASVKAGDHMDKLTVGVKETHVNDFNSADCGESTVLNNGTKQNDYAPDGTTHQDKITLMLGESTEYVGFWCSEGSVQHNDCCALAGADVIDAWATSDAVKAWAQENNIDLGAPVVDGWDRSFVGLDYEQMKPDDCFTSKSYWNGSANVEKTTVNVWDFCSDTNNTKKVKLNGKLVDASTVANDQLFFPNGQPVKWVKDDTNMYLGQNLGTNQNTFNKEENGVKYYDLDAVYACINQGAYPKQNNMEFIKGLGGRDYVFSDWIVTLTPAKKFTQTPVAPPVYEIGTNNQEQKIEKYKSKIVKQAGRVFCEDLTNRDLDDFDYNDIVFDVIIVDEITRTVITPVDGNRLNDGTPVETYSHEYYANVRLMAAGGTIPASIEIGDYNFDVHTWLGKQPHTTMINTLSESERDIVRGAVVASVDPVDLTWGDDNKDFYGIEKISDIKVYVRYGNEATQLIPEKGKASPIFVVPLGRRWAKERSNIGKAYTQFNNWVSDATSEFWNGSTKEELLHADLSGFTTGKDYVISREALEDGYPIYETISSTTSKHLVSATNNKMVVPGSGETVLLNYDPQNPGYLCPATSSTAIMTVSVPGNSNIQVGDIIRIYGVSTTGWTIYTYGSYLKSTSYPSDGYIEFAVQDSHLATARKGFTISGEKFTVTYVTVHRPN